MLVEVASAGTSVARPAPPRAPTPGGGGGGWAWLVTARDGVEAELIRGMLEAEGVPCVLDRRDPSPLAWMHLSGNPFRPVPVYVPRGLLEGARLRLLEAGLLDEDPAAARTSPGPGPGRRWARRAVGALTVVAVAWIVVVEVFGFAPCALRLFCL
jgi:hypothetical protein